MSPDIDKTLLVALVKVNNGVDESLTPGFLLRPSRPGSVYSTSGVDESLTPGFPPRPGHPGSVHLTSGVDESLTKDFTARSDSQNSFQKAPKAEPGLDTELFRLQEQGISAAGETATVSLPNLPKKHCDICQNSHAGPCSHMCRCRIRTQISSQKGF
jgi:hypothetical protein